MKLIITMISVPLLSFSLVSQAEITEQEEAFCQELYNLGTQVMTHRQDGTPMPEVVAVVKDKPLLVAFVRQAYNKPRFDGEYRQTSIQDFANETYVACLDALAVN